MKTCCGVLGNSNQQSIDGDYIKVTCDIANTQRDWGKTYG